MGDKDLELIEKELKKYDNPVVAVSWGKDSLTVLHLVKRVANKLKINFQVLWNNTGVHYPNVYDIKKQLEKEWNLDIVETRAKKTFWDIVEEYGYPGVGGSDRSDKANSACCYHIKKKPTKKAIKNYEWDLYFDGLTARESDRRYMNIREYGVSHHHKDFDLQKVHPIAHWSVDDVWDYIEKHDIPYPDVYDNEVEGYTKRGYTEQVCGHEVDRAIRNGCWCCTLALKSCPGKMKQLRTYYPELWENLMTAGSALRKPLADVIAEKKLGGQGTLTNGYYTEETREDWLEQRPCFFDDI